MSALIEIFLIFFAPGIAAAIAIGSAGKKFAWYAGTVALAFASDILVTAVAMDSGAAEGSKDLASTLVLLLVNALMIVRSSATGKKCPACQSRIHPKATRCPRCQADVLAVP